MAKEEKQLIKASLNYLRIAPRKVRLIAGLIRYRKAVEAENLLKFTNKRGAREMLKLLRSAFANAENNFHISKDTLAISEILVDDGPKLKRFRPVSHGSAHPIQKKTSHIILTLAPVETVKNLVGLKKSSHRVKKPAPVKKNVVAEVKKVEEKKETKEAVKKQTK